MAKVTMPQLGESVAEGTIGKWLKQPGDTVARDEPLLEVITDKVNAEVPSPFAGTLREILVAEGQTVPYMAEIAVIEEAVGAAAKDGAAARAASPDAPSAPTPTAAPAPTAPTVSQVRAAAPAPTQDMVPVDGRGGKPGRADDAGGAAAHAGARAIARPGPRHGPRRPDYTRRRHDVRGAAEDGRRHYRRRSRLRSAAWAAERGAATPAAQAGVSPSVPGAPVPGIPSHSPGLSPAAPSPSSSVSVVWEPGQDEVLVPHNQMRRGIAAQMTRAAAVPVAHSTFEADMTAVVKLRAAQAAGYKAREGVGLSFLPFVVKAVAEGLHGNPDLNAHYTDAGLLRKRRVNIGVAIAVENGLIVPVIHDADQLSINGINRVIQDLAARARSNKLRLDDLQGGTFTVDNTGWFGSILTVPIINTPEVCILTTEAVVKRPVVRETPEGDVIAVRSMMNLVAGYDHRATDGAQVGRFVRDVICWLEAVGPDVPIY